MCNPVNSNTGIYNSRTNNSLGTIIKRRLTGRRLRILTADDKTEQYVVKSGASDAAVGKIAGFTV